MQASSIAVRAPPVSRPATACAGPATIAARSGWAGRALAYHPLFLPSLGTRMLFVTALTSAALAVQLVRLSIGVIARRRAGRVSVGTGGDERLEHAIRAQGNFAEYVPLALILLAAAEWNGVTRWLLVPIAVAFVAGRLLHPIGIASADAPMRCRVLGMHLTLWPILALAALNAVQALRLLLG